MQDFVLESISVIAKYILPVIYNFINFANNKSLSTKSNALCKSIKQVNLSMLDNNLFLINVVIANIIIWSRQDRYERNPFCSSAIKLFVSKYKPVIKNRTTKFCVC